MGFYRMIKILTIVISLFWITSAMANTHVEHMRTYEYTIYNINVVSNSEAVESEIYYCLDTRKFYFNTPLDCVGIMKVRLEEIFRRFGNTKY